jgi:hypothetical protein
MERRSAHVVLLLAVLLGGDLTYGQDSLGDKPKRARTLDDYKPRTLKEVTAEGPDMEDIGDEEETVIVDVDTLPSEVRATYAGSVRPLPQIKKEVLRHWAQLYAGLPQGYTGAYETEILFTEDGAEYWLAVRGEAVPRFERELKRGEAVLLYLIRVGAAKASDKWEPVLLIERFQKPN